MIAWLQIILVFTLLASLSGSIENSTQYRRNGCMHVQVRVDRDESRTSMYVLLRRWMRNDPTIFTPAKERLLIPRQPVPRSVEDEAPPPKLMCDPSKLRYSHEVLVSCLTHACNNGPRSNPGGRLKGV